MEGGCVQWNAWFEMSQMTSQMTVLDFHEAILMPSSEL